MEMIIGYTLLLALFQIWLIPMMLNSKNLNWQLSNRDNEPEHPPSLMLSRATKAKDNLKETLPIFLALAVWSIAAGVDISGLAMWWLILRVAHGALYMAGIGVVRTLVWLPSIIILIMIQDYYYHLHFLHYHCLASKAYQSDRLSVFGSTSTFPLGPVVYK